MTHFEKLHIDGFRRLYEIDLKLKPLNVVIGANGSGKTSLLDVFLLLAASASGKLKETMSDLGGIGANITNLMAARGENERFVSFDLEMGVSGYKPIEYGLAIVPVGVGYRISGERLNQWRDNKSEPFTHIHANDGFVRYFEPKTKKGFVRPNWDYDQAESALSQVPKMFQEPEEFRNRLASSTHYHVLDVSSRAPIRLPQQMRDAQLPGHDGEDLVSCLYTLRETDPDRFETIEATLRAGFPDFERLNFPPVAAGTLAMTWKDKTSKNPFFMHQLSEGTLRFLWLATLLQSPGLTAVTMIDEPEVSLHPELLSLLADLLREASARTQLIVATHADRLIRFLKPSEVVTISMNDEGAAEATRADELDLEKWLQEYTFDEVWRMGRMGARP
jgi:predicted ATPase